MGNQGAPFSLRSLLVIAIVEKGGGEGAGYSPEDKPITRRQPELEIWQSCMFDLLVLFFLLLVIQRI